MPLRNLEGASLCHFEKDDVLISRDEKVEYLYYLTKGEVYREFLTPNGVEFVLTVKIANHSNYIRSLVGALVLYDKYQQYSISNCSFIAHTDCLCYRIPISSYFQFAEKNNFEVSKLLVDYLIDDYQILFEMYYSKHHKNTSAQICSAILEHAVVINNQLVFGHDISNIEFGKRLDIHPTTISKILRVLVDKGALKKVKGVGCVITDIDFIQKVSRDAIDISYRYQK